MAVGLGPLKLICATSPATPKALTEVVSVGRLMQTVSPCVPCKQLLTAIASNERPSTIKVVAGTETPGMTWTLPWPAVEPAEGGVGLTGISVGVAWAKVGSGSGVG